MKKLIVVSALMALAFALAPAHADDQTCAGDGATGAIALGGGPTVKVTCTYTASGPGAVVAATPNTWKVTVQRAGEGTVVLAESESANPGGQGEFDIDSHNGELVTITLGQDAPGDCVSEPSCGTVGFVAAGNDPTA